MKSLALALLLFPLSTFAQISPSAISTNAWLWCRTPAAASNVLATIDVAFGYPNPATLTYAAVPPIYHPTTNWVIVPISLWVYSQKVHGYEFVSNTVPANILGTLGTNIPPSAIITNKMITEATAIANGFFPNQ